MENLVTVRGGQLMAQKARKPLQVEILMCYDWSAASLALSIPPELGTRRENTTRLGCLLMKTFLKIYPKTTTPSSDTRSLAD